MTEKKIERLTVLAIYPTRAELENGISTLREDGFRSADISALLPSGDSNKEFSHEKGNKMPAEAGKGAAAGLVMGGALGWLIGAGVVAIAGLGSLIVAGPIVAALAGAGAAGTLGGITGALVGLDIPEYEAKRYEGQVREGGLLVSVHCDDADWVKRAKLILENTGAKDISSTKEAKANLGGTDRPYNLRAV